MKADGCCWCLFLSIAVDFIKFSIDLVEEGKSVISSNRIDGSDSPKIQLPVGFLEYSL